MPNPYAYYDCLSIGSKLQDSLGSVAANEMHLFGYLACLLSLYSGQPVSDWSYQFAGTKHGLPFSPEIESAILDLIDHQLLDKKDWYLILTKRGNQVYHALSSLSVNRQREECLGAACYSALALPIPVIRDALRNTPELSAAGTLSSKRLLLEATNPGLDLVYEQFRALSKAIGVEISDLMVPAVVWLSYLSEDKTNS